MPINKSTNRYTMSNSPPSNCRDDDRSPLGVGDPPDYSMSQESAPRTLVIGEEHFTFLGYHSKRRCQVPMQTSWAMTRGPLAGIVIRGHGLAAHRLLDKEWRSSPSSSTLLRRRHHLNSNSRGGRNPPSRSPTVIHPETPTEFAAGQSECSMLRPPREVEQENGDI